MLNTIHGQFSVRWCDQVCLVVLRGSFNREGVMALSSAVRQAWQDAGKPAQWAHVMDLRLWEGGTPESFAIARELVTWTVAHGVAAIVRIHHGNFLSRITERQGVLDDTGVPVVEFSSPEETWQWLDSRHLPCDACRALLADAG